MPDGSFDVPNLLRIGHLSTEANGVWEHLSGPPVEVVGEDRPLVHHQHPIGTCFLEG
jgi:hypothetical protein